MSQSFSFRVVGRVQGVGFRYFVRNLADELNVTGRVWNHSDGSVQGIAEGQSVKEFLSHLSDGPGRVADVISENSASSSYSDFEISESR